MVEEEGGVRNYALLAAILVLGAYAFFGVYKKEARQAQEQALKEKLIPWKVEEVQAISWEGDGQQAHLVRDDRGWKFVQPFEDRADMASVDLWLDSLLKVGRKHEVFGAESSFEPETYGLKEPAWTVVFTSAAGDTRKLELGSQVYESDFYVADRTSGELFVTGMELEQSLKKNLMELRDRRVWRVRDPEAQALELAGSWRLEKDKENKWFFASSVPEEPPVGATEVGDYLVDISNLRILEVVSETSGPEQLRTYNLHRPFAELKIWRGQDQEPEVLTFSTASQGEDVFVTSSNFDFVGRLYASIENNIKVPRRKFLDRSYPFKKIDTEKVHSLQAQGSGEDKLLEGARAKEIARALSELRLKAYLKGPQQKGLKEALTLRDADGELLFRIQWQEGDWEDRQDLYVYLEPGKMAGNLRAGDLKEVISQIWPAETPAESSAEQGESPSVP